jgi:hypothetical protein
LPHGFDCTSPSLQGPSSPGGGGAGCASGGAVVPPSVPAFVAPSSWNPSRAVVAQATPVATQTTIAMLRAVLMA